VLGLIADLNLEGHFRVLLRLLEEASRRELWSALGWTVATFESLGLPRTATDVAVWAACQQRQFVLFTGNRNDEGPDSLEAAIRELNKSDSLPVFTLGNLDRFMNSREYAERVADQLLEYAFDIDNFRGTGRLYLP
jgi:hypothetical protein